MAQKGSGLASTIAVPVSRNPAKSKVNGRLTGVLGSKGKVKGASSPGGATNGSNGLAVLSNIPTTYALNSTDQGLPTAKNLGSHHAPSKLALDGLRSLRISLLEAATCMLVGTCIIDVLWTNKLWTFESILCKRLQSEGYTKIHLLGPHCELMHEFWALFCTCRPLTCTSANQFWLCPSLYGGCCDCATRPVSGCSCHNKPHFWEGLHGRYSLLCGPLFHSKQHLICAAQ